MANLKIEKLLKLSRNELLIELKKVHPKERIILIKKLKEARKKEIKETEKLMRRSIEEVGIEDVLKDVEIPEEEIDLKSLFEDDLESQIESEKLPNIEFDDSQYKLKTPGLEYMAGLYNEIRELADVTTNDSGYNTRTQAEDIYEKFINTYKHEFPDESAKNLADGMRSLMKQLRGDYITEMDGSYQK